MHSIVRCQQKLWENPSPKVSDFVSRIRKLFVQPLFNMNFRFPEKRATDSKPDRRKTARKVAAAALSIGMKWNQFRRTFYPTKSKIYDVGDGSVLAWTRWRPERIMGLFMSKKRLLGFFTKPRSRVTTSVILFLPRPGVIKSCIEFLSNVAR